MWQEQYIIHNILGLQSEGCWHVGHVEEIPFFLQWKTGKSLNVRVEEYLEVDLLSYKQKKYVRYKYHQQRKLVEELWMTVTCWRKVEKLDF